MRSLNPSERSRPLIPSTYTSMTFRIRDGGSSERLFVLSGYSRPGDHGPEVGVFHELSELLLDLRAERFEIRCPHQRRQAEVDEQALSQQEQHAHREQGIAAKQEEIVAHVSDLDLQRLGPDRRYFLLDCCSWRTCVSTVRLRRPFH